ncbi:outer membrane beta-barrel protein [Tellurirhabdus rosea]|uniref:outer membrane beta-barrel protein n=1 Tax=Tellurirhabdus rosea TaxID=2674997 RepID=UPI00224EA0BB|nr:outer membrane beta-barrel protein [Tellurirhabdus rosea]
MKTFTTLSLGAWLLATAAFGQSPVKGKVAGIVLEGSQKPFEFATMLLLRAKDSTLVKGAVSGTGGKYDFDNVTEGRYLVAGTMVGYKKVYSAPFAVDAASSEVQVPTLVMNEETQSLKEVKVVTKKPFIEQQVDRTVVNVENSIVASGNTALEVLEKAPGVTIDRQNDGIQLKGKAGVIVMIDGKQTYLSAQEVANLLKNTPSDNIEKIEIITNPGSKYDAAGNSGIINIKMKRNKNFGTNGTATVGAGFGWYEKYNGNYPKMNGSVNLNHREGKISAFANASYMDRRSFNENELNRVIPFTNPTTGEKRVTYFDQVTFRPMQFSGLNYRAGLDFFATKKTTLGAVVSGFTNDWSSDGLNRSVLRDADGTISLKPVTNVVAQNKWSNLVGNLNFRQDYGQGRELTADMDYSRYTGDSYNQLNMAFYNAADAKSRPDSVARNVMPSTISIWAAKADYVHPTKKGKWEAGVKTSVVNSDNDMAFEYLIENRWAPVPNASNRFKYEENINAVYGNYSGKLNKRTSVQVGLRLENTSSRGNSVTMKKVVERNYTNLFPTVFLSRQLDTNNVLNLSYSRRIDRPNYQDLNPFRFYLDQYTYQEGNPFLQPQMTHSLQLTHVFKSAFSTSLGYSRTTDLIVREVPGQNAERNETFVMTQNLGKQSNVNLTVSFPMPVTKWWNVQTNFTVLYNHIKTDYLDARYDVDFVSYNGYIANNLTLGKGVTGEISGWYNSAGLYGFFKSRPQGGFALGVQKQVLNKKGTIRLNVNDPLWLNMFRGRTNYQDINFRIMSRWESRQVRATFTYRFGNQNVKAARQRQSATSAEQSRVQANN